MNQRLNAFCDDIAKIAPITLADQLEVPYEKVTERNELSEESPNRRPQDHSDQLLEESPPQENSEDTSQTRKKQDLNVKDTGSGQKES